LRYHSIARAILPKRFRQSIVKRANAQPVGLREAVRNLWAEIRLARATRGSVRRLEALNGKNRIKLNLGCGLDLKPGWVNIDLTLTPPQVAANAPVGTVFINHDLRLGLPLEDGCSDLIYSSHFFEHLNYKQGLQLMRECYRLLRAEGVFRISLPTFNRLFDAYLRRDKAYFDLVDIRAVMPEVEPGTETLVDQINYGVYQFGEHKCIYDEEKVCLLLRSIGFSSANVSSYNEEIDPADELRRRYSFYVEAVK